MPLASPLLPQTNKGDFCLRMLELYPGFSRFRSFHRTNKFERQQQVVGKPVKGHEHKNKLKVKTEEHVSRSLRYFFGR